MPSIITHHIFANEVFKKLPKQTKSKFEDEITIYNTFAQSHDYLFYRHFNPRRSRQIRDLGHYAHHHNTQDYLLNIIKEIKNNKLENNKQIIAYLYGSITHYILDTTCHPFIFYKTGVFRKKEKWTYKYRGEHTRIEKNIDCILYEKYYQKKYLTCDINKEIIGKPLFSEDLKNTITNVYKKTYNQDNIGEEYYNSIKDAKLINRLVTKDAIGLKKAIYLTIDTLFNHHFGNIAAYSTHITKPVYDFLNIKRKKWNHPCDKKITFTYSFEDLFNQSILKCVKLIEDVEKVIYENDNLNSLKKEIPNIDYSTGLPCDDPKMLMFFEY